MAENLVVVKEVIEVVVDKSFYNNYKYRPSFLQLGITHGISNNYKEKLDYIDTNSYELSV